MFGPTESAISKRRNETTIADMSFGKFDSDVIRQAQPSEEPPE